MEAKTKSTTVQPSLPRTLGDVIGDRQTTPGLGAIEDQPVTVVAFDWKDEDGRFGHYVYLYLTLADGRTVKTRARAVGDVFDLIRPDDLPLVLTFYRRPSETDPKVPAWDVR